MLIDGDAAQTLLMFSIVALAFASTSTEANWEPKTVTVSVWNRLPGVEVALHCKSPDDDLGINTGRANSEILNFQFMPNFVLHTTTTRFVCNATRTDDKRVAHFDVYYEKRDHAERCRNTCDWTVADDGVHGINEKTGVTDVLSPWVWLT